MQTPMTPEMIDGQLAALDAALADLEQRASDLALAATEGDAGAVATLAGVRAEMDLTRGDRAILAAARRAAAVRAAATLDAEAAEAKAKHMAEARAAADRLLSAARRIDDLVAEYQVAVADLTREQASVRSSFRAAGEPLNDARVGRNLAEAHAAFLMARAMDGTARTRADKTMVAFLETAWSELLEPTADDEASHD